MSALDPRAIASQGIGFSPRLVAAQGLLPSEQRFVGGFPRARSNVTFNDDDEILLLIAAAFASGLIQ